MATVTGVTERTADVSNQNQLERYAFLLMRLTGSGLLFLAVGHMLIQHVLNSSGNLTIQFVAEQWNSWGWKTYDMFLLVFAITGAVLATVVFTISVVSIPMLMDRKCDVVTAIVTSIAAITIGRRK